MNLLKRFFCTHDYCLRYKKGHYGEILEMTCSKCDKEIKEMKTPKNPTHWFILWQRQQHKKDE